MRCENCNPPCSYKEENKSSVCPFMSDTATPSQEFPTADACCPMFKQFDVFCNGVWYWEDPIEIPGNLYFGKNFFGDISTVKVFGNFVIDGEVNTMSLDVGGDLIVNGILDTNGEDIRVGGDLIIKGKIRPIKNQKIFVQGEIII